MSREMTASEMGRKGGKATSPKKRAAIKRNLALARSVRWKKTGKKTAA